MTKYSNRAGGKFEIPRSMHLLNAVMQIEANCIKWFKLNKYGCADDYTCYVDEFGRWTVSASNDYPLQHGKGSTHHLSHSEFKDAQKLNAEIW